MVKNLPVNAGDTGDECLFDPWVGEILWSKKCQHTSVFLPGKFHGQEPGGLQSMKLQTAGHAWTWAQVVIGLISQVQGGDKQFRVISR